MRLTPQEVYEKLIQEWLQGWLIKRFLDSYENFYGTRLSVPRWDDIADSYKM